MKLHTITIKAPDHMTPKEVVAAVQEAFRTASDDAAEAAKYSEHDKEDQQCQIDRAAMYEMLAVV